MQLGPQAEEYIAKVRYSTVASLCCMQNDDPAFLNLYHKIQDLGLFDTCNTFGDQARVLLLYRLNYLRDLHLLPPIDVDPNT